jgi:pSer/pThr/pTyr-binding forkhead associated (FHA) protein
MAPEDASRTTYSMSAIWVLRGSDNDGAVTFRIPHGTSKTVGRAARADFIVKAALVSRLHCRIVGGDQRMEVEDLSSTNGTFVNDKRIEKGHLTNGDRLRIGRVELKVERQTRKPPAKSQ